MNDRELSEAWRAASFKYVQALNEYVVRGRRDGWEAAGAEPKDDRGELALRVIEAVRKANREGDFASLRTAFPPAWEPFLPLVEEKGQSLQPAQWVDNARLAVHVGPVYERGPVVIVSENEVVPQPGVVNFGRSPCGRFCVWANEQGLEIRRGWGGPITAHFTWRTGEADEAAGDHWPTAQEGAEATQLIAFPDGQRVLLVGGSGIFVLSPGGAVRLVPSAEERAALLKEGLTLELAMPHGAVSGNGEWILAGCQDSKHLAFNSGLKVVAAVGPHSEYPHFAWFSAGDRYAVFNACHFYNGVSIGVRVENLEGLATDFSEEDARIRVLETYSRVYAAAVRDDELMVGDAHGYIRAFDLEGTLRWEHFIGSTINTLQLSSDGHRLAVTSHAGFCCVLDLDSTERDPFAIGVGAKRELWRWIFWKGEDRPLRW